MTFIFSAQSNIFQLRKLNHSETKVIDVANLITLKQFDSIITVSVSFTCHLPFSSFNLQTNDNGRVGNILSGYASLMVSIIIMVMKAMRQSSLPLFAVLPAEVWVPRGDGRVAAGDPQTYIQGE